MNPSSQQVIFKKVAVSERKTLFREMAEARKQISLKTEEDIIFHLIAIQTEKDEVLLCHHTADSQQITTPQKVMANFSFENERYFFQSELTFQSGWAVLNIDLDIFQLQRRSSARIDLPEEYHAVFHMDQYNQNTFTLEANIVDISAGGVKVRFQAGMPEFKIGDLLRGSLHLGERRPFEISVEVRHATKLEVAGRIVQVVGLQFTGVNQMLENRLLIVMMEWQRARGCRQA
ncbi:MAG: PilZ domain-containing protein, partial [Bdellovibrio sp.]